MKQRLNKESRTRGAPPVKILFAGYAPVHFVCFWPLYERLTRMPGVDVFVSGGERTKTEDGYEYDEHAMYGGFNLPRGTVLSVDEIKTLDFDILFAAHTRLILPKSVGKKIQVFHGISYRNKAVRPENMGCDHYFLVGPYMRRRFTEARLLTENDPRAISVGFMKTDRLLNGELDREQVLRQVGFSGERPILLYAPTGAKLNSMETMGEEVIRRLNESGQYDLLIKLHDHPKNRDVDWFARLAPFESAHCKIAREPDIVPLMFIADLLLSDASSATNEFSLLDRPIIFLDTPQLIAQAREANNSMLDLDTWGRKAGLIVKEPDNIVKAVQLSLANRSAHSYVRKAMVKDFFYNPGRATDVAMGWLENTSSIPKTPSRFDACSLRSNRLFG